MTYWIGQPENQLFAFGMLLLITGGVILLLLAVPRRDEPVEVYEQTPEPVTYATTTHSEFRYTVMDEWYPYVAEFEAACDAVADATTEVIRAVDPLDVTHEIERVDTSVPLFYTIRRPAPYVAESFTQGINRAQIARVLEAGRPQ